MSFSCSKPVSTSLLLVMMSTLPACHNDSVNSSPSVSSTSPVDGATGVSRSSSVTATFSEDIFAITVDGTSFKLQNNNSDINGAVTFDGDTNIATFAPDNLSPIVTYTATMTTAITDLAGNPLASNVSWNFTTADGVWVAPELVETDDAGGANSPQISFDANGNALAVWHQYDGTRYNVVANRYVAGTGWGAQELIETGNAGTAQFPQVAADANGNALAVWRQSNGTRYNILANRYVVGTGWGTAELIETENASHAYTPQVVMDANGNGIAVWHQADGTRNNIWANRYVAGSGWGAAEKIETGSLIAYSAQVSVDASGNAVAVWHQSDGSRNNIWSNRYEVGGSWGTAELIETDNTGSATAAQVSVDANGNALAVWYQGDGSRNNIWSNRYVAGGSWGTAELIETDNLGGADGPQVTFDANGNALAVWYQSDGSRNNIWANRYVAGTGWGTAELIETDNTGDAQNPQVSIDANGNALAIWEQSDGAVTSIWVNRYVAGTGWGTAALLETDDAGYAEKPQVSVDANGNAIAVWNQNDGARANIYSSRFE